MLWLKRGEGGDDGLVAVLQQRQGHFVVKLITAIMNHVSAALGSGGGSVGRAVTCDTRDPRFKSQHRQSFIYQL